jgi:hypothetical protein
MMNEGEAIKRAELSHMRHKQANLIEIVAELYLFIDSGGRVGDGGHQSG